MNDIVINEKEKRKIYIGATFAMLILIGILIYRFNYIIRTNSNFENIYDRVTALEQRVDELENKLNN